MLIFYCAYCGTEFKTLMKNQKYCSVNCREIATKQKIIERSRIVRNKRKIKNPKSCKGSCGTIISIYNRNGFCNVCKIDNKKTEDVLREIKLFFDYEKDNNI